MSRSASALVRLAFVATTLLPTCGTGALEPCDPLATRTEGVTLAAVLAIGQHADGAVYVADRPAAGKERVFVLEDGALMRKPIAGSGSGSLPDGEWLVFSVGGASPFHLKVELPRNGQARMGIVRGPFEGKDFVIGQQGDLLAVVHKEVIAGLPVRGVDEVFVEYLADLPDGRRMLVIRPQDDWTYDDFRVFVGPSERMEERKVTSVTRLRDGGTTTIVFELDGAKATAFFPAPMRAEPVTLEVSGEKTTFARVVAGERPEGASFFCR